MLGLICTNKELPVTMLGGVEEEIVSGTTCKEKGWSYMFGWFYGHFHVWHFSMMSGRWLVIVTRNIASKAWSDRQCTDAQLTVERFERLAIISPSEVYVLRSIKEC